MHSEALVNLRTRLNQVPAVRVAFVDQSQKSLLRGFCTPRTASPFTLKLLFLPPFNFLLQWCLLSIRTPLYTAYSPPPTLYQDINQKLLRQN